MGRGQDQWGLWPDRAPRAFAGPQQWLEKQDLLHFSVLPGLLPTPEEKWLPL